MWHVMDFNNCIFICQSEVEILAEASNKSDANPLFTPYLIPDANSLCTGLHIVKKLIKTEKFIFIIAKSGWYLTILHVSTSMYVHIFIICVISIFT